jgi:type VI protein secretion system component VasK
VPVPPPYARRRRPVLLAALALIALVNVVIGVTGIVEQGSTGFRWVITLLWAATTVLCVLGWRYQTRRFDERTAAIEAEEREGADQRAAEWRDRRQPPRT